MNLFVALRMLPNPTLREVGAKGHKLEKRYFSLYNSGRCFFRLSSFGRSFMTM